MKPLTPPSPEHSSFKEREREDVSSFLHDKRKEREKERPQEEERSGEEYQKILDLLEEIPESSEEEGGITEKLRRLDDDALVETLVKYAKRESPVKAFRLARRVGASLYALDRLHDILRSLFERLEREGVVHEHDRSDLLKEEH